MGSRAISALVFGLCFGIILSSITFFVPRVHTYNCGGVETRTYDLPGGIHLRKVPVCEGITSTETVGFPFAVRTASTSAGGTTQTLENKTYNVHMPGMLGNFFVYGGIGFVFFFIFSRSRHKQKSKKG